MFCFRLENGCSRRVNESLSNREELEIGCLEIRILCDALELKFFSIPNSQQ